MRRQRTSNSSQHQQARQRAGAAWERTLERAHERYKRQGRAHVTRRGPPCTFQGPPGERGLTTVRLLGRGPTDYGGALLGGRTVDFDAKSCKSGRWSLSEVKPHQVEHLDAIQNLGGVAFIALEIRGEGAWVLPWCVLSAYWHNWKRENDRSKREKSYRVPAGCASMRAEDCDRLGVRMHRPGDWYPALVSLGLVEAR